MLSSMVYAPAEDEYDPKSVLDDSEKKCSH